MTIIIPLVILCLQTINMAVSWDLKTPLILNKKGEDIFFPRNVQKTEDNSATAYVEPNDENTQTYTFCKDPNSSSNELSGILLEKSTERICPFEKNVSYRELETDDKGQTISCRSSEDGYKKYWMKYKLEIDNIPYTHTLYEYCYDEKNTKPMLYVHYNIDNPSLLGNELLQDEQNYVFELKKPSEEEAVADNDISQAYKEQTDYKPELVAIPEFIPFAHWRRSFYQWHNVAPMNKDLVKPWKLFIKRYKALLAEMAEPIEVYSGTFEVRRVNGLTQYLPDGKTEIPLFWWILLYNKKNVNLGISLIIENYAYGFEEKKRERLCGKNTTEKAMIKEIIPRGEGYDQAFIYSCSPKEFNKIVKIFKD